MAQAGFPWHSQSHEPTTANLSEKIPYPAVPEPRSNIDNIDNTAQLRGPAITTAGSPTKKANGSVRKPRSDSVRTNPALRQVVRQQLIQRPTKEPVKRLPVRTIPPWVQDADEDDLIEAEESGLLLPDGPSPAVVAQHNHSPAITRPSPGPPASARREGGYPTSSGRFRDEPTSRWVSFGRASAYPRENYNSEKVDPEWLDQHFTDYSTPWLAGHNDDDVEDGSDKYRAFRRKRRTWYKRFHFAIMRNPFVPLGFRLFVIVFAACAMALGASIYHENNKIIRCIAQPVGRRTSSCADRIGQTEVFYTQDPSAMMAIIVDAIAIVYSIYITYDEYFSKPLGLRPASAKVRLVLLDLFFIVFQSANLALAFNSITVVQGPCRTGENSISSLRFDNVCDRAETLSSVLVISLVAWMFTFSVSILRLVERINTR